MIPVSRTLTTPATLEHLEELTGMVADHLKAHGVRENILFEVDLAVDEACTNVIKYAYREGGGTVRLECRVTPEAISVCISDHGAPFNPMGVSPPDTTAGIDERLVGGLGVHIIRNLMDDISYEYRRGMNILCLTKYRADRREGAG